MKFLPLIWAGFRRHKLRTILTLLSILVAFLLYGFLGIIGEALTGGVNMAGADRLMSHHKVSFIQTLPQSYEARIKAIQGVDAVTHTTWFGGIASDPKIMVGTFPVNPETYLDMFKEIVVSPEVREAWTKTRTGAIVGKAAAEKLHVKPGDRVPFKSPIWGEPAGQSEWGFDVVGIYTGAKENTDTNSVIFRYDFFDEARAKNKGQIGWYSIRVKNPAEAVEVAKKIDEEFANSPYETKTETEAAAFQGFTQQIGDIGSIILAVVAAVFFTILLVAGNTMVQSVRERTEELGVLKALGFPNGLVMFLVLAESCFIALLGGLLGLGLAWLVTLGGNPMPEMLAFFYLPSRHVVVGVVIALGLGLAAGAMPAWQAMRLKIATALRKGG